MKVVVCSKNGAKNAATKKVLDNYFTDIEFISLETNSMVSETPMSDEEGIKGCLNRISDALKQEDDANLYVAMEGILSSNYYGYFLCGWSVIYDKKNDEYYFGCSAKVRVPDEIIKLSDSSKRLSSIVADYFEAQEDEVRELGTNGILTNGAYTRTDEFVDSLLCAIGSKYKKRL